MLFILTSARLLTLSNVYKYVTWEVKKPRVRLFLMVPSDRSRGNWH